MDKIYIHDLEVECIIGCNDDERIVPNRLVINIELGVDVSGPARTDDIGNAVNYADIATKVTELVAGSKFYLLEALAENLAAFLLNNYSIKNVAIRIAKPGAICNAKSAEIAIFR